MKTTTKRVFSLFLTLVMVLGLCTVGAFAESNTATITAKNASGAVVGSGYSSLGAAAAAAGAYGTVEISEGYIYYDSRQGISTSNVTITGEGIGETVITTSSTFANALPKNRKAVETFNAENVLVQNLTFDGGAYGRNLVPDSTEATQFNVVRVNSGSVTFQNVSIAGSKRTLLSIGTWGETPTSATVTAQNLYCDGEYKTVVDGLAYADIGIVNGTLTVENGSVLNAIISPDKDSEAGVFDNDCTTTNYYELSSALGTMYSTLKHYALSYPMNSSLLNTYITRTIVRTNLDSVEDMVDEAVANVQNVNHTTEDVTIATNLRSALVDARTLTIGTTYNRLTTMIGALDAVLN